MLVRRADVVPELQKKYPDAHFVVGEMASNEVCARWVKESIDKFGRIDLLINNAAITGPGGRLHECKYDEIVETVEIDLLAPIFLCHQVLPHFLKAGSGVVINLSGGGATNPRPYFSAYGFCKTAIVRLTENLAHEYPEFRFYAVSPGFLKTPMVESVLKLDPNRVGKEYAEAKRRVDHGGDDPNRAAELMLWLFNEKPENLNGKVLAAVWDKYKNPPDYSKETGWWTLRRVDEVVVKNLGRELEK